MQTDQKPTGTEVFRVNFDADVHLIQVLGEQLIGSEKVGIFELVKNAYDAGATHCDVWIEKVPGLGKAEFSDPQIADLEGPVITIIDNGSGMDENTIRNGWLRPATRTKTNVKERMKREREQAARRGTLDAYERLVAGIKLQYGGRIPLGEKGVGRFAVQRLGRHLILQTKTSEDERFWELEIDWDDFIPPNDEPLNLQDVPIRLLRRRSEPDSPIVPCGTMLRIFGGCKGFEWTEAILREIGQALAMLGSPSKSRSPADFRVEFHCPQLAGARFEVLAETVPAPFLCTAIVDENGCADIEICLNPPGSLSVPLPSQVWRESVDLRTHPPENKPDYWRENGSRSPLRRPACGPFALEVRCWLRTEDWVESPDLKEFTGFLDEFGGIGIYRDGMNIVPPQLGTREDWLLLSKRHIKQGKRISYYNLWGAVDLEQKDTLALVDRTSREGMLDTLAFRDLAELVRTIVIVYLEMRVLETRDNYSRLRSPKADLADLEKKGSLASKVLKQVAASYDFDLDSLAIRPMLGQHDDPRKVLASVADTPKEFEQAVEDLREQSDALAEAAGYGIAIAVAVHEIEKVTSNLYFGIERLRKQIQGLSPELYRESGDLAGTAQSLLNELKRLAPLRVTRLERRRRFRIRESILAAKGAFQTAWAELGIDFAGPAKEQDFEVYGSFGACSQVFANLFDNATYWLRAMPEGPRRIIVRALPHERKVIVADSGPGIAEKVRPHLFELYYSLKNPPSGLGLYICRYYMRQMKASIRESRSGERLPGLDGASFTLQFPDAASEDRS